MSRAREGMASYSPAQWWCPPQPAIEPSGVRRQATEPEQVKGRANDLADVLTEPSEEVGPGTARSSGVEEDRAAVVLRICRRYHTESDRSCGSVRGLVVEW